MNGLAGRHNFILEWNCCGRYTARNVQSSPLENLRVLRHFNNLIFLIAPLPSLLRRLLFHFTYWILFNLPTTYPPKRTIFSYCKHCHWMLLRFHWAEMDKCWRRRRRCIQQQNVVIMVCLHDRWTDPSIQPTKPNIVVGTLQSSSLAEYE